MVILRWEKSQDINGSNEGKKLKFVFLVGQLMGNKDFLTEDY